MVKEYAFFQFRHFVPMSIPSWLSLGTFEVDAVMQHIESQIRQLR